MQIFSQFILAGSKLFNQLVERLPIFPIPANGETLPLPLEVHGKARLRKWNPSEKGQFPLQTTGIQFATAQITFAKAKLYPDDVFKLKIQRHSESGHILLCAPFRELWKDNRIEIKEHEKTEEDL